MARSKKNKQQKVIKREIIKEDGKITLEKKTITNEYTKDSPDHLAKIGILDPEGREPNPLTGKNYSVDYIRYSRAWRKYPTYQNATEYLKMIKENKVILVTTGTGAGKTVLFPKYCLHISNYTGNVYVTLPKRELVRSAAVYSAATLDVKIGQEVGYKYKGNNVTSNQSKLVYTTDGSLRAILSKNDPDIIIDTVIIDEAHERSFNIDFLLFLCKKRLKIDADFKLIVMSATVKTELFMEYFSEFGIKHIHIPGESFFPVEHIFLTHSNKIDIIKEASKIIEDPINAKKTILMFVPKISDTYKVCQKIKTDLCVELHAKTQKELVDKAKEVRIDNTNKLIAATNLAESSLTIEGIDIVIDSGLEINPYFDFELGCEVMAKNYTSKAQSQQRAGRSGRTKPGTCYHLYTSYFYETFPDYPEAEIKKKELTDDIFGVLAYMMTSSKRVDIAKFFSEFLDPPTKASILYSITKLISMKILQPEGVQLTNLGETACYYDIPPGLLLPLIRARSLSCLHEVAKIAAVLFVTKGNISHLFHQSNDKDNSSKKKMAIITKRLGHKYGDHMASLEIFNKSHDSRFIKANLISRKIMKDVENEYNRLYRRVKHGDFQHYSDPIREPYELTDRIMACFLSVGLQNTFILKGKIITNKKDFVLAQTNLLLPPRSNSTAFYYVLSKNQSSKSISPNFVGIINKETIDLANLLTSTE